MSADATHWRLASPYARPVVQELRWYGRCTELPLALLTLEDVTASLHARFPGQQWPAALAPRLPRHLVIYPTGALDDQRLRSLAAAFTAP